MRYCAHAGVDKFDINAAEASCQSADEEHAGQWKRTVHTIVAAM